MNTVIKTGIVILLLMIMAVPAAACGEPATPTTAEPTPTLKKITLADAPMVLDMSSELPASFEHLDAASEELSNADLGLGPDFSEVELFLSEEPYQMIFAYLCIIESRVEQAGSDAVLRDEELVESIVMEGIQLGAAEEGVESVDVDTNITYPDIGDLTVLGSGTMSAYGVNIGYDILMFKSIKVYVFIASTYLPGESVSLTLLAEAIEQRIGTFSQ